MLRRETVERIKKQYPEGTMIQLRRMEGEASMKPGTKGIVSLVDDIGQIHVAWENGRRLALNIEEDCFDVIQPEEESMAAEEEQIMAGPK